MSLTGFTSPEWFLLLLVAGLLVVGYVLAQRSRRRRTLRFANLALLERVGASRQGLVRHVPAALLIVAVILLTTALAGPTAEQKVPRNRATVMLVIDVSLSMEAADISPNRLVAAQRSATSFVQGMTPGVNIGVVSFAGTASVLVPPTTDRKAPIDAIKNLELAESTATGEGIFAALQSIESFSAVVGGPSGPPPARIVLMADGKQVSPTENMNDPRGAFTAARAAEEAGVPISTIAFGTSHGTVEIEGRTYPVEVDDVAMEQIAEISGGQYYKAESGGQLNEVYEDLGEQIGYEIKKADASKPWLALGTLALIAGAGASLFIGQRLP
ncbi:VWA domain-containing protein [Haloechinothrix halophila]|uniref:VWA domain-containing protein n=1 Tax=Haloechinothrix halophila TaxID=1069073 RepID=UPI00040C29A6|nr:VWA domain-containing protein [Haloechinothrix halophila]